MNKRCCISIHQLVLHFVGSITIDHSLERNAIGGTNIGDIPVTASDRITIEGRHQSIW